MSSLFSLLRRDSIDCPNVCSLASRVRSCWPICFSASVINGERFWISKSTFSTLQSEKNSSSNNLKLKFKRYYLWVKHRWISMESSYFSANCWATVFNSSLDCWIKQSSSNCWSKCNSNSRLFFSKASRTASCFIIYSSRKVWTLRLNNYWRRFIRKRETCNTYTQKCVLWPLQPLGVQYQVADLVLVGNVCVAAVVV